MTPAGSLSWLPVVEEGCRGKSYQTDQDEIQAGRPIAELESETRENPEAESSNC